MKKIILLCFLNFFLFALDLIKPLALNIDNIDISEYLVSEKLDGVRGYWDGKNLYSKNGNLYNPPKDYIKDFPPFAIDGELYCDKDFSKTLSDVKSSKFMCAKLYVFEVPNQKGVLLDRLQILKEYLAKKPNKNIVILPQYSFKNKNDFFKFYNKLIKNGAEGVVLHKKSTLFSTKTGKNLIKLKKYFTSICVIKKINKNVDKLASYECEWDINNSKFAITTQKQKDFFAINKNKKIIIKIASGFNKIHRENPLSIGDKISFKYYKVSNKLIPIHSVFIRQVYEEE